MGIKEVKTAPRSPWQNPYVERLIGTLRRDCIDHVIVVGENHLLRILRGYLASYHSCRTHLSLEKDSPEPREDRRVADGWRASSPLRSTGRLTTHFAR
jgi:putative transposase